MSDSEDNLSSAADIPSHAEIEECIRNVVREAVKKDEEVTVKLGRTRAEQRLGLEAGFLKDNAQWKEKSRDLINAAFEEPPSPEVAKKAAKAPKAKPAAKAGTKRKSDETQPSRKKAKNNAVSESEDDTGDFADDQPGQDGDREVAVKTAKPRATAAKSEDESALSDPPEDDEQSAAKGQNGNGAGDDESELSSVIDDGPPAKKKRQKKSAPAKGPTTRAAKPKKAPKAKAPAEDEDESDMSSVLEDPPLKKGSKKKSTSPKPKSKPAATTTKTLSPDEEEIKRLQSWLLKCGIRKLWHRELAPFDTNKEKIRHLKGMLDEVGMTGRFSAEKAKSIKESRELKAELEAAMEFNKTWGHDEDEEDGDEDGKEGESKAEEKPAAARRTRPIGFVDFGDSDEDSE